MADKSKIEWTDASWNPLRARRIIESGSPRLANPIKTGWHCEHVSEGCRNCYAERMNLRLGTGLEFKPGHRRDITIYLDAEMLALPLRWKRPRKVFANSMTDLFADFVTDEDIARVFAYMAAAYWHTFQVLTKRTDRMKALLNSDEFREMVGAILSEVDHEAGELGLYDPTERRTDDWRAMCPDVVEDWPLRNIWIGTSIEDQETADARVPALLATPATVRFLSCEPMLGPIDLYNGDPDPRLGGVEATHTFIGEWWEPGDDLKGPARHGVDWIIVGGESGPAARPMHPDWARSLRDQCSAALVPFFFKQWGEWAPGDEIRMADEARDAPPGTVEVCNPKWALAGLGRAAINMKRVGKREAGRQLDGKTYDDFPQPE